MSDDDDSGRSYKVVTNHEEQYSIWFADRPLPAGWRETGKVGSKSECLAHIREVWVDMRPASLRRAMDQGKSLTS
ncbi:MbtH family protein [Pendulispora albinea]|uniref:MbtH family NRPS accessory protein n=1 Tax=Pendulispora albinea TaxID=2741071 RepID=A0ABZ2MB74_9BACT